MSDAKDDQPKVDDEYKFCEKVHRQIEAATDEVDSRFHDGLAALLYTIDCSQFARLEYLLPKNNTQKIFTVSLWNQWYPV